ncbi:MAG: methyltransferase family protein [Promethearchaeota archaeon]
MSGVLLTKEQQNTAIIFALNLSLSFIVVPSILYVATFLIMISIWGDNIKSFYVPALFDLGLIIMFLGVIIFFIGYSNIMTEGDGDLVLIKWAKTKKFVRTGLYKYVRHPMSFGYLILLLGVGINIHQIIYFILYLIVFVLIYLYLKKIDEPDSIRKFPEYKKYMEEVPFLIPIIKH